MYKQNFTNGRMNLDADIRLLPKGDHREAYNIEVIDSEGSDQGAVEYSLSNKQLTNYDQGDNVFEIGKYAEESQEKIYWFTKSDKGCYLFEWDQLNQLLAVVLEDTRPEDERVFNLHEDFLITGIEKVVSQDIEGDLLLFTDNYGQPYCINVERAKNTYRDNNFVEEDILLIKKPPRYAPVITPTYTNDGSNNLEERFIAFTYRYRYLDGEYSALSDYTNYNFNPKPFNLDYFNLDNLGMINTYNAVRVEFNTGESQVTEIQLVVKESNSNNLYIVETFSKEKEDWDHGKDKSYVFSNNKTLQVLPEKELFRAFDNVPLKAKSLCLTENIPVFGNYLEGFDIVDKADEADNKGTPININYTLSLSNSPLDQGEDYHLNISDPAKAKVEGFVSYALKKGKRIIFDIDLDVDSQSAYSNSFFYTLEQDYISNINSVFSSDGFKNLMEVINADLKSNYDPQGNYDIPDGFALQNEPSITYAKEGLYPVFTLTPLIIKDVNGGTADREIPVTFTSSTNIAVTSNINSVTCKTNRNYEVGVVYMDKYNRRTTVLTSKTNTFYVPQKYSIFQNLIVANINSPAPAFADRYKLVVKSNPLQYQTIYITEFYSEEFFTWCKLSGNNKDKVSEGDYIIIKKAGARLINEPIKIKVLEIATKEEDFIKDGNDVVERAGTYMKIRPTGFSMDLDDYKVDESTGDGANDDGFPNTALYLFSKPDAVAPEKKEIAIPAGTSITINFLSSRHYDAGVKEVEYNNEFFAQRDYDTIEDWMIETLLSKPTLKADDGTGEFEFDYRPNISLYRTPNGYLFLRVMGVLSGSSGFFFKGRSGRISAKIVIRTGSGFYVFETLPKQADSDIFYETAQCLDIVDGQHMGNTQNQNANSGNPAIVSMDFFNCYTQGNGIESYRVRDEFNTNALNIDLRPSATSVEQYRQVRRTADLTYGKPYIESTNINGLNEFNVSTANFKELDKQYGTIQHLATREGNIAVWQQNKTGYVLFGKDLLTLANGGSVVGRTPEIIGMYQPYDGNNGTDHPESIDTDGSRFYYANANAGSPMRLSRDGTTEINYGVSSYFRDLFIENPTSKKVGGYDPYFKKYFLFTDAEITKPITAVCGNTIQKISSLPFEYNLVLNNLLGDILLNYDIAEGNAEITATLDGVQYTAETNEGSGTITIPRTSIGQKLVNIQVVPMFGSARVLITNLCPIGVPLKVTRIVINDEDFLNKTINNRYRWGGGGFFADQHLFDSFEVSQFETEEGIEGVGKFPARGTSVNMQSFKDTINTAEFNDTTQNRLGYFVTDIDYGEANIEMILDSAGYVAATKNQISLNSSIVQGTFTFNRPSAAHNLYLIWDYSEKNRAPIAIDDNSSTESGGTVIIPILDNDYDPDGDPITVTLQSQTVNGTLVLNTDGTVTYIHDGSLNLSDSFTYYINDGKVDSNIATVNITVAPAPCDSGMDVIFLFDYTASMGDQIEAAKAGAVNIISVIEDQSSTNNYRLGIVLADEYTSGTVSNYSSNTGYTELPASQKYVTSGPSSKYQWLTTMQMMETNNEANFITQINKMNNYPNGLPLGGGYGDPEPTDLALSRVIENDFAGAFRNNVAKYVIIITDQDPGGTDDDFTNDDLVEVSRLKDICISKSIKIIVLGSGVDAYLDGVYPWKDLATGTGGAWNTSFDSITIQSEITNSCAT